VSRLFQVSSADAEKIQADNSHQHTAVIYCHSKAVMQLAETSIIKITHLHNNRGRLLLLMHSSQRLK